MDVSNILNSINIVTEKIFKSVEGEVFSGLDKFLLIDEKILKIDPLTTLYIKPDSKGLVVLVFSFVIFFFIYYIINKFIAMYSGENVENIFKYMLRVIICVICSMSCTFLIEQVLSLNGMLSAVIQNVGKDITGQKICFENLREIVKNLDSFMSTEAISVDGVIKGVISFGATTVLISFAIRYVTIIFLILISPIAIMFASSDSTLGIFKNWCKLLIINLMIQNVVLIILMIPISVRQSKDDLFKIILVGSIYLLYKLNNFTKDLFGTISQKVIRRE